jgi:hypothetical protein
MACPAEAQALEVVKHVPRRPWRMATCPLTAFGHDLGHEVRADAPRALLDQAVVLLLDAGDAADAGAQDAAEALAAGLVQRGRVQARVAQRLGGRDQRPHRERIELAQVGRLEVLQRIPLDAGRELDGLLAGVEALDRRHAVLATQHARPRRLDVVAERVHGPQAGDGDSSHGSCVCAGAAGPGPGRTNARPRPARGGAWLARPAQLFDWM